MAKYKVRWTEIVEATYETTMEADNDSEVHNSVICGEHSEEQNRCKSNEDITDIKITLLEE